MAVLAQLIDDVVVHKFDLAGEHVAIGRHPESNITVDDSAVSANHAVIEAKPNEHFPEYKEFFMRDLGSTNGTYINDLKVSKVTRLHNNDVIRIAWNKFKFIDDAEADLERTVQMLHRTKGV